MWTAMLIAILAEVQSGAIAARQAPATDTRVVVAAPVYQPDGAVSAETATLPNASPNLVFVYSRRSMCDTAITAASQPSDAGFGWRVAAHTISKTPAETVVSVDWRRVWDRGQTMNAGPAGTVQLTLHPGDRIPLDHIPNMQPTAACRAVGMGLELRLARSTDVAPPPGIVLPLGAAEGGAKSLDADVWLLHTPPSGMLQVQHQTVRLTTNGGSFAFSPIAFPSASGDVGVEMTGSFRRYRQPTGAEVLVVSMARLITGTRVPPGGVSSSTATVLDLPGPDDVVSFEMPGARAALAGGRGGGGGGRGGRGLGPTTGTIAALIPNTTPPGAVTTANSGGGTATNVEVPVARTAGSSVPQARGGGGGGGGRGGAAGGGAAGSAARGGGVVMGLGPSTAAPLAQAMALLDGHTFSIRVRLTPVPGGEN